MKIPEKKEQLSVPAASIFVPLLEAERASSRGVAMGSETIYSPAESFSREGTPYGSSEREDLHQSATQTGQVL